ncbi:DUF1287 domain-containing protein [Mycobacterium sp. KBS0706]|uniref:DUF1287 domain-containing protein n=1 Tax=Mycobacterium sp. KBS0706 TaxID=2578109 RepID=UPI00110F8851|nr:DUF1287 domain-containing protein [Mycobacterium sp. KBS0706]TSD89212.1 DUF1287 domain-containing protein [Mycobacterium sp. KBS0706]
MRRRLFLFTALLLPIAGRIARAEAPDWPRQLVAAAEAQIGVTVTYDPAYARLAYPGGDVPRDRGVCTDVVIRAYRDAFGIDLQRLLHEDMRANFSRYPRSWGLSRPDPNIDHRRVPNLQAFFRRRGRALPAESPAAFAEGDLVTQMLPGNLPHIAIVTGRMGAGGAPLVIHNIGGGARLEDRLLDFPLTGRYRFITG